MTSNRRYIIITDINIRIP